MKAELGRNRTASLFHHDRSLLQESLVHSPVSQGSLPSGLLLQPSWPALLVDLMVIGNVGLAQLSPVLRKAEKRLGREVNLTDYSIEEFRKKAGEGDHFLTTVLKGGLQFVKGEQSDLDAIANNEVQQHKTSKKELDKLRAVIRRDLADASLDGASADRRFAIAYNAALQAAKMAIACAGYRVVGAGHHSWLGDHIRQLRQRGFPVLAVGHSHGRGFRTRPFLFGGSLSAFVLGAALSGAVQCCRDGLSIMRRTSRFFA